MSRRGYDGGGRGGRRGLGGTAGEGSSCCHCRRKREGSSTLATLGRRGRGQWRVRGNRRSETDADMHSLAILHAHQILSFVVLGSLVKGRLLSALYLEFLSPTLHVLCGRRYGQTQEDKVL